MKLASAILSFAVCCTVGLLLSASRTATQKREQSLISHSAPAQGAVSLHAKSAKSVLGKHPGCGALAISPDDRWLLSESSTSEDGLDWRTLVRLWNLETGEVHDFNSTNAGFARDGRVVFLNWGVDFSRSEKPITMLILRFPNDLQSAIACGDTVPTAKESIVDFDVTTDGREIRLLTNFFLRRFDGKTGQLLSRIAWGDKNTARSDNLWSLSPDGQFIRSMEDSTVAYNTKTGRRETSKQPPIVGNPNNSDATTVTSHDGKWLYQVNAPFIERIKIR